MTGNHPSDATLLAYAAGSLPLAHAMVVRTHLALCPDCREAARLGVSLGGALLEDAPPADLAGDALERTLARLDEQEPLAPAQRVPSTIEELATGRWIWLGPGIRLMPLIRRGADGARLDLIRVKPGACLPGHGHTGMELACVLKGAFQDETGEYRAGDFAEGDEALDHCPVALPVDGECVCLISTSGRLRAHSWLARLIQPIFDV
ncbi:transcriptional regulator [Rhodovarius crocodyli]|uniref:Transcriptional regulator n=1 Tax=Rhodovarius crocodyli TaxID=1979269 RepID=A0A437M343_9PROT|nr:ChrR family anti-sigma-E factor [Rhodovarius crocodyli]RVT92006.1 transcriptional regulator [Rhodovarius crocodyli]